MTRMLGFLASVAGLTLVDPANKKAPRCCGMKRGANGACRAESAGNAPDMDIASRQQACQSPI
jgi:hypothetical protein